MNELFGLSMTHIMIGLLVVLAVALSTIGYVLLRNRIMFMVGVRNIPRRRAQTILIVIGLMLSTLIISAAFSIGDTVDYSITNQAYSRLYNIDEVVSAATAEEENDDPFESSSPILAESIAEDEADRLVAQIKDTDGVDGAVSVLRDLVPATSETQQEARNLLVGLDGQNLEGFDDVESLSGEKLSVNDLGHDEIYVNESLADKLDITAGGTIDVAIGGIDNAFTVKAVVKDRVLSGAAVGFTQGMVLELQRAQELLKRPDEVDFIAVSNNGGSREGLALTSDVMEALDDKLALEWTINDTKKEFVDAANETSSFITTFFTVLGLFSIAAGMMLIFLIFVMLAAERKVEMGMVRAVGTKRSHLVQMFMSEGMVYNLGAALVGVGLGIVVSIIMMGLMARLFSQFDLNITFHVTARSLIISYSIGVVLTFLTVVFSSSRVGALNIVSAIRDLPDPSPRRVRPSWSNIFSFLWWVVFKARRWSEWGIGLFLIAAGAVLFVVTFFSFVAAAAVHDGDSTVMGTLAVLLGIGGGFAAFFGFVSILTGLTRILQMGGVGVVLGIPLIALGVYYEQYAPFAGGISLVILGSALTISNIGFNPRAVFTATGLILIVYWLLGAGDHIPPHDYAGDIEMFFLSGVTMVLAGTFVLVYNADLILNLLTLTGDRFSSIVPSIKTAVAYPLANRFRTGMTIAMISLVMFALVMMSTMNENFDRIFLSDDALGGYQVAVSENPNNPLDDVRRAVRENGGDQSTVDGIVGVDNISHPNEGVDQGRNPGDEEFEGAEILGLTDSFLANNQIKFSGRAVGYESDREIWDAMAENPDFAVIDGFSVNGGDDFDGGFIVEDIDYADDVFEPATIEIRDAATGKRSNVTIIGVTDLKASFLFSGLLISPAKFTEVYGEPETTMHYVRLADGVDARDTARAIEAALLKQGAEAESLRKFIEDQQALSRGFLYLIQGFMGLGLFVGIAAVGVIAFRTVVERRQQIGMLRAIGYTRGAISLSFLMESSFVTLLGIFSGIGLGLLLAQQLVQTDGFVPGGVDSFYIPWLQISLIAAFAFVASFLMTLIPSRQASSVPIAEALRYE